LDAVSFEVAAGGRLVVTGPNGAGKSTLLRLVAGLEPPSQGEVELWGLDAMTVRVRHGRRLSALLGGSGFYEDLTVRNHLELLDATWGASGQLAGVDQMLGLLGLERVARLTPPELSSGLFQLFSLAVACRRPADLVVLDEPEQHLDADRRERVAHLLNLVAAAGRTLVVATHAPELVAGLGGERLALEPAEGAEPGFAAPVQDLPQGAEPRGPAEAP
jgi:ABC-type multidrug transport system ATPase subunit